MKEIKRNSIQKSKQSLFFWLKHFEYRSIKSTVKFTNEPEILFLGTISMKPTASRSASWIYMNFNPNTEFEALSGIRTDFKNSYGIMLDCSEGSYGQLYDHFEGIFELLNIIKHCFS